MGEQIKRSAPATVRKKVTMHPVVKRVDGTTEDLGKQVLAVKEYTEADLAELIGEEEAAEVFRGAAE